jgi:hypothetical protein
LSYARRTRPQPAMQCVSVATVKRAALVLEDGDGGTDRDGPLEYLWTMAYLTPGGQATQVFPRKVNTFWKPILIYCKGAYGCISVPIPISEFNPSLVDLARRRGHPDGACLDLEKSIQRLVHCGHRCIWFQKALVLPAQTRLVERHKRHKAGLVIGAFVALLMTRCTSIGPGALNRDSVDYARALSNSRKREILLNIVRTRYGDVPVFLSASQVISHYVLEGSVGFGGALNPNHSLNSFLTEQGTVGYSDRPTFSFTPMSGEDFSDTYLRPLSPAQLLPLGQGSLWVDGVMRICVQSIGRLRNSNALNGATGTASPGFYRLIGDLRALQTGGALSLRFQKEKALQKEKARTRIFLVFSREATPDLRVIQEELRRLLEVPAGVHEAEIVYGRDRDGGTRIFLGTRSFISMLEQVGAQMEVPEDDVRSGRTYATPSRESPSIRIHSGSEKPSESYVFIDYRGKWFWVDDTDYPSKTAFSILELARSVAESGHTPQSPIITIPAE